jgi:hypothetical protein
MNAAQIRVAKERFGTQLDMTEGPLDKAAILERVAVGVLFEVAAQLADLNENLNPQAFAEGHRRRS